jgi:O-antigen/teichoic acid export membrane protein
MAPERTAQDERAGPRKPGRSVKSSRFRELLSRVGQGAAIKLGAELVGRALQFLLIYVAQRQLGPAGFGQLTYALALGVVVAPLTDLGVQLTMTQQIAKAPHRAQTVTGVGLSIKLALAAVACLLMAGVSQTRPDGVQAATFVLGLAMIVGSFGEFFGYTFRGLQRIEIDAALTLLTRVVTVTVGLWLLSAGLGLTGVATAYLTGSLAGTAGGWLWLRRRFFSPTMSFQLEAWGQVVRRAAPLGAAIVLSIAYTRTAVFVLDALQGPDAVGTYGVALKLTEPLAILPAALLAAVFPAVVGRRADNDPAGEQLRVASTMLLAGSGVVVAAVGVTVGPWLIDLLYGVQYARAAAPFQVLAVAVLFTFVNYALTHFVIAHDLHRRYLAFTATVFVLNLVLCLALVPRFGPVGAAWSVVLSEAVLLTLCWRVLPRPPRRDAMAGRQPVPLGPVSGEA